MSRFLGAGKTTLLNRVLHNREGLEVTMIVNDTSSVKREVKVSTIVTRSALTHGFMAVFSEFEEER